jgi:hypothetical protein
LTDSTDSTDGAKRDPQDDGEKLKAKRERREHRMKMVGGFLGIVYTSIKTVAKVRDLRK